MSSREGRSFREFGAESLRLVALCAFALAQPLYDVLGDHPQFFISRGSERIDIALFVLALSLGAPLLAIAAVETAGLAGARVRRGAAVAIASGLVAVTLLPVLNRAEVPAAVAIAASAATGLGFGAAYVRADWLRSLVTALSPAALIFPLLFLLATPVATLAFGARELILSQQRSAPDTPVIFVVFDLLPTTALMDAERNLDAARYPGFAELARQAWWFRNATTVAPNTARAVPAILTGMRPRDGALALAVDYPANLFTWLAPTHELRVFESETQLCPPNLCGDAETPPLSERLRGMAEDTGWVGLHILLPEPMRDALPPINAHWHGFADPDQTIASKRRERRELIREGRKERRGSGRVQKFRGFVDGIEAAGPTPLAYLHLPLPHPPFVFLPSGQTYIPHGSGPVARRLSGVVLDAQGLRSWGDSAERIRLGYQRMTWQIGFVDKLLSELIARLRSLDLFDRSLIVVVADHGMSFVEGGRTRFELDGNTLFVPFFIKLPGQTEPVVDDSNAETIDVLPTAAAALGVELPWPVEGRSLLETEQADRSLKRVMVSRSRRTSAGGASVEHADWPRLLDESLAQKLRLTGAGPMEGIYDTGPYPELVGHGVAELQEGIRLGSRSFVAESQTRGVVRLDQTRYLRNVRPGGLFLPAYLTGRLELPGNTPASPVLAVALNGVVRATTRAESREFGVLVPPGRLVRGPNRVKLFVAIAVGAEQVVLQPLF